MNESTKTLEQIETLIDTLLHVIEQQAKTIDQLLKLKADLKQEQKQAQELLKKNQTQTKTK